MTIIIIIIMEKWRLCQTKKKVIGLGRHFSIIFYQKVLKNEKKITY